MDAGEAKLHIRATYQDVMPELDSLRGVKVGEIAATTKTGIERLARLGRLNLGRKIFSAEQDLDLHTAEPDELLGKGTSAEAYTLRFSNKERKGLAHHGYARKQYLFLPTPEDLAYAAAQTAFDKYDDEFAMERIEAFRRLQSAKEQAQWRQRLTVQSAARSIWATLDKKLQGATSPLVGFLQSNQEELILFQEMLPYTQAAVIKGIYTQLPAQPRKHTFDQLPVQSAHALMSLAYLFKETAGLARAVNEAGIVDRDMKPANIGMDVSVNGGQHYKASYIDNGEFIIMEDLTPEEDARINFSESTTFEYAPSRMHRSRIGLAPDRLIASQPHDNVTMLGYIIALTINPRLYAGVQRHHPGAYLKSILDERERFSHNMEQQLIDPALAVYTPILRKALNEELVEAGQYTIQQLERDLDGARAGLLAELLPVAHHLSDGVRLYRPHDRKPVVTHATTAYYGTQAASNYGSNR